MTAGHSGPEKPRSPLPQRASPLVGRGSGRLVLGLAAAGLVAAGVVWADGAGAREQNASDSHQTRSALRLSDEARDAIRRIHHLHRRPHAEALSGEDRRLLAIERATRRITLLIAAAVSDSNPKRRLERLELLEAEWAKWQQLRADVEEGPGSARRRGLHPGRRSVTDTLSALEASIAKDVAAASELASFDSSRKDARPSMRRSAAAGQRIEIRTEKERRREAEKLLRELRSRPEDPAQRFHSPMVILITDRQEGAKLQSVEGTAPAVRGEAHSSSRREERSDRVYRSTLERSASGARGEGRPYRAPASEEPNRDGDNGRSSGGPRP